MTGLRSKGLGTNIAITFLRQGLGLVVTLGLVALIARTLGPDGQGKYALAILLSTLIVILSNLGVPSANVYFIGRGDVSVNRALRTNVMLWVALSVIGVGIGAGIIRFFADRWFPSVPEHMLWITLAGVPISLLHAFLVSLLQGLQDFHRYNIVLFIQPVLAFVLTAVAILGLQSGTEGALWAYVLAWLLSLVFAWWALAPHVLAARMTPDEHRIKRYAKRCVGYGWRAQIANNLAFFSYRSSTLLINFYMSPATTGLYVTAVAIAEKIWLLSQAASQVLLPRLSELHTDEARRRRLTPLATKLVFLVSMGIAVVLFVFAGPLIVGVFTDKYEPSIGALRWLLPGVVALSVARGVSIDLAARGRVDLNLYVAIVTLASIVVASVLLIPRYGINGAAMATTLSYLLNTVIKLVLYHRITGIRWYELMVPKRADVAVIKEKIASVRRNDR
ncbi:MAG: flippase [Candidatus Krumholzibacteria bacterium]|nr:flippase [Candidatus Krumholzibacteria bacterium]